MLAWTALSFNFTFSTAVLQLHLHLTNPPPPAVCVCVCARLHCLVELSLAIDAKWAKSMIATTTASFSDYWTSLTNGAHLLQDSPTDCKLDFLYLTETWQQPDGFSQLDESTPPGVVYICHLCVSDRVWALHGQNLIRSSQYIRLKKRLLWVLM